MCAWGKFAFACVDGEEYILRPKVDIHPLFPLVDILCYNSLLLYTVPIIVAIIYLRY